MRGPPVAFALPMPELERLRLREPASKKMSNSGEVRPETRRWCICGRSPRPFGAEIDSKCHVDTDRPSTGITARGPPTRVGTVGAAGRGPCLDGLCGCHG